MEFLVENLNNSELVVKYESYVKDRKVFDIDTDNSVCWYDCHPFDEEPVFLPKYNNFIDTKKWNCIGVFCSFSCAYGYARRHNINTIDLMSMFKKLNPKMSIKQPYPRESLKMFGGYLDITTFRENNGKYNIKYTEWPIIHSVQQLCTDKIEIKTNSKQTEYKLKEENNVEDLLFDLF